MQESRQQKQIYVTIELETNAKTTNRHSKGLMSCEDIS